MTPIELVLSKLPDAKRSGDGWKARCPAHDDKTPSLSVNEGDDGRALLKCHAGCETPVVVAAMGLTMADLMPDRPADRRPPARRTAKTPSRIYATAREAAAELERSHGPRSALWTYRNAKGEPVGVVLRWDLPDDEKDIRPVSRNTESWFIGAMPAPRPLYCLTDLAKAKRVYVSEGEPATEATQSVGLTATTSAGGSKAPHKTDWTPLAGREVVILPDNDDPGGEYAREVAVLLGKVRPRPAVKIVELPDLPEHGDMVEHLSARRTAGLDDGAIRAEIEAMADAAEPVELARPEPGIERFEAFPIDVLPEPVRGFVNVGAEAMCCDTALVALPMLAALASAIGNSRRIELKRGWSEPAVIWTAIVANSGTMKSPAQELALRPVHKRQRRAMQQYDEAMGPYEDDMLRYECGLLQWKRNNGEGDPPVKPTKPTADRCWCADATVEALAVLLLDQPRGLLMARDELAGWLGGFDRYVQGKGGDVAKWLEMFGGRAMMVDRKSSGPLYVPMASVSIVGTIQPDTLRRALGRQYRENGLAARLLVAQLPRRVKRWTEAEIPASGEAKMEGVFDKLYGLQLGIGEDGEPCPVTIRLTPAGKAAWIAFFDEHAAHQVELTGDLSAAWSKLEGYTARLALVIHYVRWAAGDPTLTDPDAVDEQSIAAGVVMSRWFGGEARRIYAMLDESDEDTDRRRLVQLIRRKKGSVTARELMRSSRKYQPVGLAEAALDGLVEDGLGSWENVGPGAAGGRPTRRFILADTVDVDETPLNAKEDTGCGNVNTVNDAQDDWGKV